MEPVKANLVCPLNDPYGEVLSHLEAVDPSLKAIFARAVFGVTGETRRANPDFFRRLDTDGFYHLVAAPDAPVGEQFAFLYRQAAAFSAPDQVNHLCFIDRLVYILQSEFVSDFTAEMLAIEPENTPLLFSRSVWAWSTHPRNYYEIEHFAVQAGMALFGRALDFAWCHLAVRGQDLARIMPAVENTDLSMLAEMVMQLMDALETRAVDWLAWEDPFLLNRDADELRAARENSPQEAQKRLGYILPMLETLLRYSRT